MNISCASYIMLGLRFLALGKRGLRGKSIEVYAGSSTTRKTEILATRDFHTRGTQLITVPYWKD